jgi:hypothetical protein
MQALDLSLGIVLLGLSTIMLMVSVQAYRRTGGRMVWVLISFLGFTLLSITALWGVISGDESWSIPNPVVLLLLLVIGANYLALIKG